MTLLWERDDELEQAVPDGNDGTVKVKQSYSQS